MTLTQFDCRRNVRNVVYWIGCKIRVDRYHARFSMIAQQTCALRSRKQCTEIRLLRHAATSRNDAAVMMHKLQQVCKRCNIIVNASAESNSPADTTDLLPPKPRFLLRNEDAETGAASPSSAGKISVGASVCSDTHVHNGTATLQEIVHALEKYHIDADAIANMFSLRTSTELGLGRHDVQHWTSLCNAIVEALLSGLKQDSSIKHEVPSGVLKYIAEVVCALGRTVSHRQRPQGTHSIITHPHAMRWDEMDLFISRAYSLMRGGVGKDTVELISAAVSSCTNPSLRAHRQLHVALVREIDMWLATQGSNNVESIEGSNSAESIDIACSLRDVALDIVLACRAFHCIAPHASALALHSYSAPSEIDKSVSLSKLRDLLTTLAVAVDVKTPFVGNPHNTILQLACHEAAKSRRENASTISQILFATCTLPSEIRKHVDRHCLLELCKRLTSLNTSSNPHSARAYHAMRVRFPDTTHVLDSFAHTLSSCAPSATPVFQSEQERILFGVLKRVATSLGWPAPLTNTVLSNNGFTADFVWPSQRFVVEVDGPFHFLPTNIHRINTPILRNAPHATLGFDTEPAVNCVTRLRNEVLAATGWHVLIIPAFTLQKRRISSPNTSTFVNHVTSSFRTLMNNVRPDSAPSIITWSDD